LASYPGTEANPESPTGSHTRRRERPGRNDRIWGVAEDELMEEYKKIRKASSEKKGHAM